jgi:site-specific DNA recombinase
VAYCRVSTEEQAEEGYSIEGQADKLRAYANLRGLGEVVVIEDPGRSGKDMKRPGLQQLLGAVDAGHVDHILVWRLDRLSRNLGDLILLADTFGERGVALHSVSESLDLSSASGRMFYNILGTFAQFFREQLSENVKMGNERAVREGKWLNRAKIGYEMVEGELVATGDAVRVREVFKLRAEGLSYRAIEERTAIKYSTVMTILDSRVYLGEVVLNGHWHPGRHEAIVSVDEWEAAHRTMGKGVQPSKDVLRSHVRCGLCCKRMVLAPNGQGSTFYRCWHRGKGCDQPARSNKGLSRAAVLGMSLLGSDPDLQAAIRRRLRGEVRGTPRGVPRTRRAAPAMTMEQLTANRDKLLGLLYAGQISGEGFKQGEDQLLIEFEVARRQAAEEEADERTRSDLERRFEEVAQILSNLDIKAVWKAAEDDERRVLVDELVEWVTVFPDHLEVKVAGAPSLNVRLSEVGLKESQIVGVGGPT